MLSMLRLVSGKFLFTLVIALALGGCTSLLLLHFEEPDVHLTGVEIRSARLLEQEFVLSFRIENPNPFTLEINHFSYALALNDIPLARGTHNTPVVLPARGQKNLSIVVKTNLWRHLASVLNLIKHPGESINYHIEGVLEINDWIDQSIPISKSGSITPKALIKG